MPERVAIFLIPASAPERITALAASALVLNADAGIFQVKH